MYCNDLPERHDIIVVPAGTVTVNVTRVNIYVSLNGNCAVRGTIVPEGKKVLNGMAQHKGGKRRADKTNAFPVHSHRTTGIVNC